MLRSLKEVTILGIDFFPGSLEEAVEQALRGGLVLLPSGPGLASDLPSSSAYREALAGADLVLPDSGAMVLMWNALSALRRNDSPCRLARLSGLKFLRAFLENADVRARAKTFWVMPSPQDQTRNLEWLRGNGFPGISEADCYVAPDYRNGAVGGAITDRRLLEILEDQKPDFIFLNVGGGIQEPLGHFLRNELSYRPTILCSGAAIAFLTGRQANIPPWADRYYLGWLFRTLYAPRTFFPRYLRATRLFFLMLWYGERSPLPMDGPKSAG